AIELIRMQGEGTRDVPDPGGTLAHYYRLLEIVLGKTLVHVGVRKWTATGDPVPFPPDTNILPMTPLPAGAPESRPFDLAYSDVLRALQRAWDGADDIETAVGMMFALGERARDLMRRSLGPTFTFV